MRNDFIHVVRLEVGHTLGHGILPSICIGGSQHFEYVAGVRYLREMDSAMQTS